MNYDSEDFKNLKYNVYDLPKKANVLAEFPELGKHVSFHKDTEPLLKSNVIKYIVYCYDKDSPLIDEENLPKRKEIAAELAGFKRLEDGEWDTDVLVMIKGKNEVVNRMSASYCRHIVQDTRWSRLVALTELYYESVREMGSATSDIKISERMKINTDLDGIEQEIKEISEEIFSGDANLVSAADEINQEELGRIQSYPEHIAMKRAEKESKHSST